MPILLRLVLRGYYSRTIGSPLLPIRLSRHPQLLDDLESFRRESARRATIGRIPKLEISPLSLIPKCQFFRQTKDFNDPDCPFAFLAKIPRKNIACNIRARVLKNKNQCERIVQQDVDNYDRFILPIAMAKRATRKIALW